MRSPFASFLTYLSFGDEGLSDEDKKAVKQEAKENVENALFMLDNLLLWATKQANDGIQIYPKLINIKSSVELVIQQNQGNAALKSIQVHNKCDPKNLLVDENIFHTIIRNLLSNAFKFSPSGSSIQVYTQQAGNWLELIVQDAGAGIPDSVVSALRNNQGAIQSERGTRNEKGAGLGLRLCLEFAELIGAEIDFEVVENEGTRSILRLPITA